jgi:hypothetical protein
LKDCICEMELQKRSSFSRSLLSWSRHSWALRNGEAVMRGSGAGCRHGRALAAFLLPSRSWFCWHDMLMEAIRWRRRFPLSWIQHSLIYVGYRILSTFLWPHLLSGRKEMNPCTLPETVHEKPAESVWWSSILWTCLSVQCSPFRRKLYQQQEVK